MRQELLRLKALQLPPKLTPLITVSALAHRSLRVTRAL
jgi:hypothetical protein